MAKLTNRLSDRETNDVLSAHVSLHVLERCYNVVAQLTNGLSDRETNDVLSAHVSILERCYNVVAKLTNGVQIEKPTMFSVHM